MGKKKFLNLQRFELLARGRRALLCDCTDHALLAEGNNNNVETEQNYTYSYC
jgi:hypothetical protein